MPEGSPKTIQDAAMAKDLPASVKEQADTFYKLMHSYGFTTDDARFVLYTVEERERIKREET